jgi:hypothetical protein
MSLRTGLSPRAKRFCGGVMDNEKRKERQRKYYAKGLSVHMSKAGEPLCKALGGFYRKVQVTCDLELVTCGRCKSMGGVRGLA